LLGAEFECVYGLHDEQICSIRIKARVFYHHQNMNATVIDIRTGLKAQ